jgi:glycyl-tRNA synthetase
MSEKLAINKQQLDDLLRRRFYIAQGFEIYGGVAGLYDFGPSGAALKTNIINHWRRHFVLEEGMLEVDTTCLTPYDVLQTSGHVAKFQDIMVVDSTTGMFFRADHVVEEHMEKLLADAKTAPEQMQEYRIIKSSADSYTPEELHQIITRFGILSPEGNTFNEPIPFNLMFQTSIGPVQHASPNGFLRPETAQGIFLNFKRLLEYNNGKMPFAGAQVGRAFRNEIAPRGGLIRVREFEVAEIEHFVHPDQKNHPKFKSLSSLVLTLWRNTAQMAGEGTIELSLNEAVEQGFIANETLAYFMGRTQLFLLSLGIARSGIRFRQHLAKEMAHYACDCWDAELLLSSGWLECVGHADRACYDLTVHSKKSGTDLVARVTYDEPVTEEVLQFVWDKKLLGKTFKRAAQGITAQMESMGAASCEAQLSSNGSMTVSVGVEDYLVSSEFVKFEKVPVKVTGYNYAPSVIEPSFGIGRILQAVLEHAFFVRAEDEQRAVLGLNALVAPLKVMILPLSNTDVLLPLVDRIRIELRQGGISCRDDCSSAAIGRRYARADELGVPFDITVDFDTVKDNSVTLRERNSSRQVRGSLSEVIRILLLLCSPNGGYSWEEVEKEPSLSVIRAETLE